VTALGWFQRIDLESGIRQTYEWYRSPRFASGVGTNSEKGRRRAALSLPYPAA
jgi:hypothetical protein